MISDEEFQEIISECGIPNHTEIDLDNYRGIFFSYWENGFEFDGRDGYHFIHQFNDSDGNLRKNKSILSIHSQKYEVALSDRKRAKDIIQTHKNKLKIEAKKTNATK